MDKAHPFIQINIWLSAAYWLHGHLIRKLHWLHQIRKMSCDFSKLM